MKTIKKILALSLAFMMLASVIALPASAATAPAATSKITVTRSTTELKLTWTKVNGATGYRIYYKLPGDLSWRTAVSSTTKTTHTFKELSYGQSYKFAVRSYTNSNGKTTWGGYREIATATKTTIPKHFYTESITTSAIKFRWTDLPEADGYKLYYRTSPSESWKTLVSSTKSNSCTIKNLPAGQRYYFAVKAFVKSDFGTFYGDPRYLETATKPATPTIKASTTSSSISLSWSKVSADGYRIYYKTTGDWKIAVSSTTKTSHTFKNLPSGKTYTFAVKPYIKTSSGEIIWGGYKQLKVTTKSTVSIPSTKAEFAAAYNKAINDAKAYKGTVTVKKHDIIEMQLYDLPSVAEKILLPVIENLTATEPQQWTFKNGVDVNDSNRMLSEKITPWGRNANLQPEGIASASVTTYSNGGYVMKGTLIPENSYFNGYSDTIEPTYNKGIIDPLELGALDLGPVTIQQAQIYYSGTSFEATVDAQGRLVELNISEPIVMTGTGKAGISLTLQLTGTIDSNYKFTYK